MALQSEPINRPSSGCHAGGPPHKDSPYGVTPTHPYTPDFQALHPVAEPVHTAVRLAGLFFFSLFLKQPPPGFANRSRDLIKIFSASTFWRRRGTVRGVGGTEAKSTGQLHAFISSLCPTISPPHFSSLPTSSFDPRPSFSFSSFSSSSSSPGPSCK